MTPKQVVEFKEMILHYSIPRSTVRKILSYINVPDSVIYESVPMDFDVVVGRPMTSPPPLVLGLLDPYLDKVSVEKVMEAVTKAYMSVLER